MPTAPARIESSISIPSRPVEDVDLAARFLAQTGHRDRGCLQLHDLEVRDDCDAACGCRHRTIRCRDIPAHSGSRSEWGKRPLRAPKKRISSGSGTCLTCGGCRIAQPAPAAAGGFLRSRSASATAVLATVTVSGALPLKHPRRPIPSACAAFGCGELVHPRSPGPSTATPCTLCFSMAAHLPGAWIRAPDCPSCRTGHRPSG